VILGISAAGQKIPPFIIFQAKTHLSSWYIEDKLPSQWRLGVSENGWTTNKLSVAWIKHFNVYTERGIRGTYRLLILDGHKSHSSVEFEEYCKENKIVCLCMPPHSLHLLQPLDVGCFSPLKKAYLRQVKKLMRNWINYITKTEFLPAFIDAFDALINGKQIKGGFRGAGLVPFNTQVVLD
jgi:DDE superfamily endonuclease